MNALKVASASRMRDIPNYNSITTDSIEPKVAWAKEILCNWFYTKYDFYVVFDVGSLRLFVYFEAMTLLVIDWLELLTMMIDDDDDGGGDDDDQW